MLHSQDIQERKEAYGLPAVWNDVRVEGLQTTIVVINLLTCLKNRPNIVSYSDIIITSETGPKIITPYLDAAPLHDYLAPQYEAKNVELSFIVYRDISRALAILEETVFQHNDINEHTILVGEHDGQYTAYLTGFSEFTTIEAKNGNLDMASLTSLIQRLLPGPAGYFSCDPEWRSLISQTIQGVISAGEVYAGLEAIAPGYKQAPFRTSLVTKRMKIRRLVDKNGTEIVRLLDLLRIVLYQNAKFSKDIELAIRKLIRRRDLIQLNDDDYCTLHYADKLLYYIDSNLYKTFLDLDPPYHSKACWY